jgi:DnaJ-class molecular chaperone
VPAGVDTGTRLRLGDAGLPGLTGRLGNVMLRLLVVADERFTRHDLDLRWALAWGLS